MYISGNGELYDDEEVFYVSSKNNTDYSNDQEDDYDFQNIDVVIISWETRLSSRF